MRARRRLLAFIVPGLLVAASWQFAAAGWIHAKAILAQMLLERAWNQTLVEEGAGHAKPWPWADTWPVAKLIIPELAIEQIVLAGDSGRTLAFGPGHSAASALPGEAGLTVIGGHRDTHFRSLGELDPGNEIILVTKSGSHRYRVTDMHVVDSRRYRLAAMTDGPELVLVTCYPFDAITPGGPLRYLVRAGYGDS
jgi:sortase A